MSRTGLSGLLLGGVLLAACAAWSGDPVAEETADPPTAQTAGSSAPDEAYRIGAGDVLEISVWKDEALTRMATVLPDGRISFPLIGQLTARGKTVEALKQEIEAEIIRYVPDPVLSVEVRQVNSMMIYVIGRVNHPSRFPIHTRINVLQALSMAGGLDTFAKRNRIRIFRETSEGTEIIPFEYDKVSDGEALEQNILLRRGDVIVVP
jgi:polysaccharide biosynthesis/export protein